MDFKESIVNEIALKTTRSWVRDVAHKDLFNALFDVCEVTHEKIYGLAEENWIETASYESLIRLAEFFSLYDNGLGASWLKTGMTFKVRARHYNYKLLGPFGLISLCKLATSASYVEYIPIKGRVSVVFCYVTYDITKPHVAYFRSLMKSLEVVGTKLSVYVCQTNNFAADVNRPISTNPAPGINGDVCYKIL